MNKKKSYIDSHKPVQVNRFYNIAIDLDESIVNAKSICFIGNVYGLFGTYEPRTSNTDDINIKNTSFDNCDNDVVQNTEGNERFIRNYKLLKEAIKNHAFIYVISDRATVELYNYMMDFIIKTIIPNGSKHEIEQYRQLYVSHVINYNEYPKGYDYTSLLLDLVNHISNIMKFDYIIQNPPYSGTTHIDFFKKGLDMLSPTGKMVIIEPATMYIDTRDVDNVKKIYNPLKDIIRNYVTKVYIDNYNKEFNINSFILFAITYIDKCNKSNYIDFEIFKEKRHVQSIYDCVLVGTYSLLTSIMDKCKKYGDIMIDHKFESDKIVDHNTYFTRYAYIRTIHGPNSTEDYQKHAFGTFYNYGTLAVHKSKVCTNIVPIQKNKSRKDTFCWLFGSKGEINNFIYYAYHNKLPLFLSIITTIGQNNWLFRVLPWICDKKYTDNEIYNILHFSQEEIKLIEKTVMYYEKSSPIFMRYMSGPDYCVTNEEVQKFIDKLENEYK